jgi:hypothetical protein
LVLQLFNTSSQEAETEGDEAAEDRSASALIGPHGAEEWGEFLHLPGQRFSDFAVSAHYATSLKRPIYTNPAYILTVTCLLTGDPRGNRARDGPRDGL